jgi:hypothetical protein
VHLQLLLAFPSAFSLLSVRDYMSMQPILVAAQFSNLRMTQQ